MVVTATVTGTVLSRTPSLEAEQRISDAEDSDSEYRGSGRGPQEAWQQEGTLQVLLRFPRTMDGGKLLIARAVRN